MKLKEASESRLREMEEAVTESYLQSVRKRAVLPQSTTEYDSLHKSLLALRTRFEGRGIMHSVRRDASRQAAAARNARAMAPGAYGTATLSDRFRTGEENGMRYMTSADFVRYYKEHRRRMRPDADLRYMAVVRNAANVVPRVKPKKTALASVGEADRRFAKALVSRLPASVREKHPAIEKRAAEVHGWIKSETVREAPKSEKRKFPISVASAILVTLISLSLVVGGTVMESDANARYREASATLEAVKTEELNLEHRLSVRMDLSEIEDYARNTLGMVDRSYAEGVYLDGTKAESVEIYEEDRTTFGLSTLLSALGLGS